MPRLSTIAIDASVAPPPAQWSAAWVQRRLVDAYAVERRMPHARRRISNAWPPMVVEFSDIVGRADEARRDVLQAWESDIGVSAEDVSRMEAAHDWLRTILREYPLERICLSQWATTIAYGRSISRLLAQRQWSRSTFYRHVGCGAHVIALELRRQGEPVV